MKMKNKKIDENQTNNTYTFFWGSDLPFSQFYPARFVIDNVAYNCTEQFMMHQKALLFNDKEIADEILKTEKAGKQKKLGRLVGNYDDKKWGEVSEQIVYTANFAKFTQNKDLLAKLLETKNTELVEVSPTDTIWGIGLPRNNPKILDKTKWRGKNKLGMILTELREELRNKRRP